MSRVETGQVFGHCGKSGRIARAIERGQYTPSYKYNYKDSSKVEAHHAYNCPCCQDKIRDAMERNGHTTYNSSQINYSIASGKV